MEVSALRPRLAGDNRGPRRPGTLAASAASRAGEGRGEGWLLAQE